MSAPTPMEVEDAMVAALAGDAWLSARVRTDSIACFAAATAARAAGALPALPAILVSYVGGPVEAHGGVTFRDEADFQVLVMARNLRSVRGARQETGSGDAGARVEPGAVNLLWRARAVLGGKTLDLDMSELRPTDVELVDFDADKRVCQMSCTFRTRIEFDGEAPESEGDVVDLSTILAAWTVEDAPPLTDTHTDLETEGV